MQPHILILNRHGASSSFYGPFLSSLLKSVYATLKSFIFPSLSLLRPYNSPISSSSNPYSLSFSRSLIFDISLSTSVVVLSELGSGGAFEVFINIIIKWSRKVTVQTPDEIQEVQPN
ncbi:hypothetical protein FGO68_gene1551 [Halteria grandinella]|uniref:Uncharacterized protein n=1 Tax=Halteria grandinella TaxID=5974 RepID=A0A8J8P0S8_HALGN|nr:hypothetical protein FGO68_gene1551 [Halteria grandinella]